MSLIGLEGYLVNIEIDVSAGIPCWDIVGLPDASVKEAKERVRTAIKNSGYDMQSRKIVVNLSPADIKKEGSFFDLPIAIGILACSGNINKKSIEDTIFIGELSLDGKINKVNGVLPMCIEAKRLRNSQNNNSFAKCKRSSSCARNRNIRSKNFKSSNKLFKF